MEVVSNADIVTQAHLFAIDAHMGQVRRWSGKPFIDHLSQVVAIVSSVPHSPDMLATAWLHDVLDNNRAVSLRELADSCGRRVASMVETLSEPRFGVRDPQQKLEIARAHVVSGPAEVHTVKLACIISNAHDIAELDVNFARTYVKDQYSLIQELVRGDRTLLRHADRVLHAAAHSAGILLAPLVCDLASAPDRAARMRMAA